MKACPVVFLLPSDKLPPEITAGIKRRIDAFNQLYDLCKEFYKEEFGDGGTDFPPRCLEIIDELPAVLAELHKPIVPASKPKPKPKGRTLRVRTA